MSTTTAQTTTRQEQPSNGPGAPRGNRNGMRHGLRSAGLPDGCRKIETGLNKYRRAIEDCVIEARGEVSLVDAGYIASAYRWERHAALAQRWLRMRGDDMSDADRLNYSREVARASSERDKAVAALNLPIRPNADPWATR